MSQKIPLIVADLEVQLATAIAPGGTTFTLSSVTDDDGNACPNGLYCFTLDNGSASKEYLLGNIVGTSVTGVKSISRQGAETTGAVRAHRVGASVIITDFIAIKLLSDTLRGAQTLDGGSPLSYDTQPTLANGLQIATVQYVLDVVSGGSVNFSVQSLTGLAGETLAANDVVYFKESDQRWYKADADTAATVNGVRLGINLSIAASAGDGVTVQISGPIGGLSGLVAGTKYYVSNTAGALSSSAGTTEMFVGTAISSSSIFWYPGFIYIPTATQKAAMDAATSPSSTNPFVTKSGSVKFGGTGADGALTVSSGTTTIDLGGERFVVKNYTNISITGTGVVAFSNPHASGTIIVLKATGNVTLTSSATPMLDASGLGAAGGAGVSGGSGATVAGNVGNPGFGVFVRTNGGGLGTAGAVATTFFSALSLATNNFIRYVNMFVGAGGASGGVANAGGGSSSTTGAGGRGGGCLIIECAGAWNFTTANGISVNGKNGADGSDSGGPNPGRAGSGGGSAGFFLGLYNAALLIANTGTITKAGGTGSSGNAQGGATGGGGAGALDAGTAGSGGGGVGGNGAVGFSYVGPNTEFA